MNLKCSICGKEINSIFDKNNPEPVLQEKGAVVCGDCNYNIIVLARRYLVCEGGLSSFLKLSSDKDRLEYLKEKGVYTEDII